MISKLRDTPSVCYGFKSWPLLSNLCYSLVASSVIIIFDHSALNHLKRFAADDDIGLRSDYTGR
jgi:hypothetical protein